MGTNKDNFRLIDCIKYNNERRRDINVPAYHIHIPKSSSPWNILHSVLEQSYNNFTAAVSSCEKEINSQRQRIKDLERDNSIKERIISNRESSIEARECIITGKENLIKLQKQLIERLKKESQIAGLLKGYSISESIEKLGDILDFLMIDGVLTHSKEIRFIRKVQKMFIELRK